jgi:hypothetical protein
MKLMILAVYSDNTRAIADLSDYLTKQGRQITDLWHGEVEVVYMEMESSIEDLEANLRQLKG